MTNEKQRLYLRQHLKERRRQLTERQKLSTAVQQQILNHPFLTETRHIASYQSLPDELDTWALNQELLSRGHRLALPVITPTLKGQMNFYTVSSLETLRVNQYGIKEPLPDEKLKVRPDYIEVMLVPLLGFDLKGNRLGMGGGYYDRMLKKVSVSCLTVGLAFDEQEVDALQNEPWDMPLDEVITPTRRLIFCAKD